MMASLVCMLVNLEIYLEDINKITRDNILVKKRNNNNKEKVNMTKKSKISLTKLMKE